MQSAYKAELNRLVKEGIITEVKEHTEWINSIVPVMKSSGSLRLCLDPKDLNKAVKRNWWYSRTIDNIPLESAKSKFKGLKDAASGYWYVVLDLASKHTLGQIKMVEATIWIKIIMHSKKDMIECLDCSKVFMA